MTRIGTVIGALALVPLPLSTVAADEHIMAAPDSLKWGPGPAALPKGACRLQGAAAHASCG
jgi:hypothetical protein